MDREIKFRAWYDENKCYYYSNDEAFDLKEEGGVFGLYEIVGYYRQSDQGYHFVSDKLEQYTGLKDKNGTEIYEGDIVLFGDKVEGLHGIGVVRWYEDSACFRHSYKELIGDHDNYEPLDDSWRPSKTYWADVEGSYIEVIGNIHENPELLNE